MSMRVFPGLSSVAVAMVLLAAPLRSAHGQALTLTEALDAALASHPSLRAADLRADAADARVSGARAQLFPSLLGSAGLTRFEEPMVVAPLHGFDPLHPPAFDETLVQGRLAVEYTLFDGGARRALIRSSEAAEAGSLERRESAEMELLEGVTAAFVGTLAAREVREAAGRQVAAFEEERAHAEQRLAEGTAARVEVLRAEAALQGALAEDASAAARAVLAERSLARLMGALPATIELRALADVTLAATEVGASADATDPRADAARRSVDAARGRLDLERAARLPVLRGAAGLLGYGSGAGDPVGEWQAGVSVSWPLFTGGARAAAVRQAELDVQVEEEMLRSIELTIAGELDAANAALVETGARTRALLAAVAQWEEVARIEALGLAEGAGVQQDYLRAEAAVFEARAAHTRARYDEILAHVRRTRVQGGLDRDWINDALEIGG